MRGKEKGRKRRKDEPDGKLSLEICELRRDVRFGDDMLTLWRYCRRLKRR